MPRMKMLTLLDEPRPCTMFMLGTAPCRPAMSLACKSFMSCELKALIDTGTFSGSSLRRRAVTTIDSSVVGLALAGAACCVVAACGLGAGVAEACAACTVGAASASEMAAAIRLMVMADGVRRMVFPSGQDGGQAWVAAMTCLTNDRSVSFVAPF